MNGAGEGLVIQFTLRIERSVYGCERFIASENRKVPRGRPTGFGTFLTRNLSHPFVPCGVRDK